MTNILIEAEGDLRKRRGYMKTEAEIGVVQPQAKECLSRQNLEEVRRGPLLEPLKRVVLLLPRFRLCSPEMRENTFLSFQITPIIC